MIVATLTSALSVCVEVLVTTIIVLLHCKRDALTRRSMNGQVFPLAEVPAAFKVSMSGKVQGKLGITVA